MIAASGEPLRAVVLDAEAISQTDTDGADILAELATELARDDAVLALARVESSILELWRRTGAVDAIGEQHVFHTVAEAVEATGGGSRSPFPGDDEPDPV